MMEGIRVKFQYGCSEGSYKTVTSRKTRETIPVVYNSVSIDYS